jgi:hypothetical protein
MPKLVFSSEKAGCGATTRHGETCLISVAQSGVLFRSYRKGLLGGLLGSFFGPILYNEKNVYRAAKTAEALHSKTPQITMAPGKTVKLANGGSLTLIRSYLSSRIRAPSPKNVTPPIQMASIAVSSAEPTSTSRLKDVRMKTRFRSRPIPPHPKKATVNKRFMIPRAWLRRFYSRCCWAQPYWPVVTAWRFGTDTLGLPEACEGLAPF